MTNHDAEHSLFSASGSAGWMVCHGKLALEAGRNSDSAYADEGTAAHELAKWVLTARIDGLKTGKRVTAANYHGTKIRVASGREFIVDDEMVEAVDDYVDSFMIWTAGNAERWVEQRVHYHEALGVEKHEAYGTGDGLAILFDAPALEVDGVAFGPGDELQIHDLKYGRGVRVDAEDNSQMRLYALGALWEYGFLADVTRVRMVIHQPRKNHRSEEVITTDELLAWAAQLPAIAMKVKDTIEVFNSYGRREDQIEAIKYDLQPSDKGCRWCEAKAHCPALLGEVSEAVGDRRVASVEEFADLTIEDPATAPTPGDNYAGHVYAKLPLIRAWVDAMEADINRRVFNGAEIADPDGGVLKVVEGPPGNRAWRDAKAAEGELLGLRLSRKDITTEKLISPAAVEKALKRNPAAWEKMQNHIYRPPGRKYVTRASDPKPAVTAQVTADEFEDLTASDDHPFR